MGRKETRLNMDRPPIKDRPGGIYREYGAIGKIWELLSDQEWHSIKELETLIYPVSLQGRLRELRTHGPTGGAKDNAWSKSHNWRIEESDDHSQVKMLLSPL